MLRNYYKDLELDKSANIEDIKKSFRRLALLYHPDKDNSLSANQKFNEINEAYQVLSDSDKRSKYDSAYSAQFNPFVTYVEAPSTQNWAYHHKRKVKYVVERKVKYSYQSKRNAHYFLLLSLLFVLLIFIDALLPKKNIKLNEFKIVSGENLTIEAKNIDFPLNNLHFIAHMHLADSIIVQKTIIFNKNYYAIEYLNPKATIESEIEYENNIPYIKTNPAFSIFQLFMFGPTILLVFSLIGSVIKTRTNFTIDIAITVFILDLYTLFFLAL